MLIRTERSGSGKYGHQSAKGLFEFCSHLRNILPKDFTMAEIGCYAGESTLLFCYSAGKVYAIDPWVNGYDDTDASSFLHDMSIVKKSFDIRTKHCTNLITCINTSEEEAKLHLDNSFDFVYIDAHHSYESCKNDIITWLPKIKTDGYIGGHDFCGRWGKIVDAVLETIGLPDFRTQDGSWLKKVSKE